MVEQAIILVERLAARIGESAPARRPPSEPRATCRRRMTKRDPHNGRAARIHAVKTAQDAIEEVTNGVDALDAGATLNADGPDKSDLIDQAERAGGPTPATCRRPAHLEQEAEAVAAELLRGLPGP